MGRTIAAVVVVFAMAMAALQHADLIGSLGEPVVLLAMGTLFIVLSRLLNPPQGAGDAGGLGATVLNHPAAAAA